MVADHPDVSTFDKTRGPRMWCWSDEGKIRPLDANTYRGLDLTGETPRVFCIRCGKWVRVIIEINSEETWDSALRAHNIKSGLDPDTGWKERDNR